MDAGCTAKMVFEKTSLKSAPPAFPTTCDPQIFGLSPVPETRFAPEETEEVSPVPFEEEEEPDQALQAGDHQTDYPADEDSYQGTVGHF